MGGPDRVRRSVRARVYDSARRRPSVGRHRFGFCGPTGTGVAGPAAGAVGPPPPAVVPWSAGPRSGEVTHGGLDGKMP
jgi:hypothetical protein